MISGRKDIGQAKRIKLIKLIFLSFFCATNCSAQLNEFTCTAPINEWKFVLQLRKDSVFKYEAFSKYGRWDLLLGKYVVKKNKLYLKMVSSEERERLDASWGEEKKYVTAITTDTLSNGEVVIKKREQIKITTTIPVSWNIISIRPSFFIIKDNRLYQRPVKKWPKTDLYFSRIDSSSFNFIKMFR